MVEGAGGGALRAEPRITPSKIQGGAAEVNTPASFPTISHNFGKPRSKRRGRDATGAGAAPPRRHWRNLRRKRKKDEDCFIVVFTLFFWLLCD